MPSREWLRVQPDELEIVVRHQATAPVLVGAIARDLGLKLSASTLHAGISGAISPDQSARAGFAIRINRHDPDPRQRFTVAHEIGHYLIHRDQIGQGIVDDVLYRSTLSDRREAEANRLAADILMPDHLVAEWLDRARALNVEDIPLYLADRFRVSEAAMKIRLGLI